MYDLYLVGSNEALSAISPKMRSLVFSFLVLDFFGLKDVHFARLSNILLTPF